MTASAEVRTDRPSPYLKQLCKHFRHKHDVEFTDAEGIMRFPFGSCRLQATDGVLTLIAQAGDEERLAYTQRVVGSHLERFGRRDALTVSWTARS